MSYVVKLVEIRTGEASYVMGLDSRTLDLKKATVYETKDMAEVIKTNRENRIRGTSWEHRFSVFVQEVNFYISEKPKPEFKNYVLAEPYKEEEN